MVSMPSATILVPVRLGELGERRGHRAAHRIAVEVAGEADVELDDVGAELEDVPQARIAGAGVVDGDAHAGVAQRRSTASSGS